MKKRLVEGYGSLVALDQGAVIAQPVDGAHSNNRGNDLFQGGGSQNTHDPGAGYRNSGLDVAESLAISHIWAIPWYQHASGLERLALVGWKYTGITTLMTGFSMNPGLTGPHHGLANRPNRVSMHVTGPKTVNEWFNTAAFAAPLAGYFGNAAKGSITGPGLVNFEMAFYKYFRIKERGTIELRSELFNIFNHTNFSGVSTAVGAGNYGKVTSARDPRIVEFALRFRF